MTTGKKFWPQLSAETWIAASSMVIALCALVFSLYSAWLERDHQMRSTRPEMLASFVFDQDGSGFRFGNIGLGPARLKWFQVLVDGQPKKDWEDMLRAVGISPLPDYSFGYPQPIYSTESYERLFLVKPGSGDMKLRTERNRIELRACYCSIFDECWVSSDRAVPPRRIGTCEPAPGVIMGGRPGLP